MLGSIHNFFSQYLVALKPELELGQSNPKPHFRQACDE